MAEIKRIDGESRFYEIDGVMYPSVTTILSVINKPALIGWAKKSVAEAVRPILEEIRDRKLQPSDIDVGAIIKLIKARPSQTSQDATDVGTEVHLWCEKWITEEMKHDEKDDFPQLWIPLPTEPRARNCVEAFLKWAKEVDFLPKATEMVVYSKKKKFAGTIDAIGYVGGQPAIIDFKSSSGIWPEMSVQVSAYRVAHNEMFPRKKINRTWILRLGKNDGVFEPHLVDNHKMLSKCFSGARAIWDWQQSLKPETNGKSTTRNRNRSDNDAGDSSVPQVQEVATTV